MTTALSRPRRLNLDSFSRAAGVHPELVARLVRLGLLDATLDIHGELLFDPAELGRLARIQRLREGLSVNYAALGLVLDLLDRIDDLEAALRRRPRSHGGSNRRWTRTV
jgi:chaperone modulatory protein CbpM